MQRPSHRRAVATFALAAFLLAAPAALAQHVRDAGRFFGADAAQKAESDLAALQNNGGRNVVVETFDAAPAGVNANDPAGHDAAFGPFVRQRGSELKADVYVLVNRNPAHLRVWPNPAGKSMSESARKSLVDEMGTAFKAREFDRGLAGLVSMLQSTPTLGSSPVLPRRDPNASAARQPAPGPVAPAASVRKSTGLLGGGCFTVMLLVVGAVVLFVVLKMFRRNNNAGGPPPVPYGQPGYGQPGGGYGNQGGGGMGGFGSSVGGGLLGGVLGSVIGNKVFGQHSSQNQANDSGVAPTAGDDFRYGESNAPAADNYSDSSGADFGSSDSGDSGGGSDSSGSDF